MLRGKADDPRETNAALARVPDDVQQGARKRDAATGDAMVAAIRARTPVDGGSLLSGVTQRQDGEGTIVEASAVRDGGFDYARAVEFGRHATPGYFAGKDETGGGADAHPFFLDTAYAVLQGREPAMDGAIDDAAKREGFR